MSVAGTDCTESFDWGRTSEDYAKFRDIYPGIFYRKLVETGLCVSGQKVLDIGTGTGVLPRNLYKYGAEFTGLDVSENQ
ncbi:MAG: class I SAM-dependent methyltransferase, partial [Oscillospiraceae bacterium]|nr:class I SAM-dependent methyltransferase [Oscillospiraceae bacterium]